MISRIFFLGFGLLLSASGNAQTMTPELLWSLGRVSPIGITDDESGILFRVTHFDIAENNSSSKTYILDISSLQSTEIEEYGSIYSDPSISPNGNHQIVEQSVKVNAVEGAEFYPDLPKSEVQIYDALNYRHWDTWEDGAYNHILVRDLQDTTSAPIDLLDHQPYSTPTEPFGGSEDYTWNHDGTKIFYVCKKEYGTAYAQSTNTDIYSYDLATKITTNLTSSNQGYDTNPMVSSNGILAWLQMDEPGYEADKNDIILLQNGSPRNLTADWDGTVSSFIWEKEGQLIYFIAPVQGTKQLFSVSITGSMDIKQLTEGQHDITSMIGQVDQIMYVTRMDMNHAAEIFSVDLESGEMIQVTHVNDDAYSSISLSKVEKHWVKTTDSKEMLTWVIYPPNFDPEKKYPTLLYCQGGPQSPLSQFYSFRWNFQLMAAHGYIIVAPNRRGMPGYGVAWNEQISGDWGGQNIQDYLSAIDQISEQPYVDTSRVGCIGASYGGYSVFVLAGMHDNRFNSFIAHDGVFNTQSMYGTTEELFFVNKDLGGPYWQKKDAPSYQEFNPVNYVDQWNTPMLIIQGGKDYRVPIGQGLEAFQAAQLQGIKSKLLYFPNENHWVLSAQNGIVWQREFFKWLEETL